MMTNHCRILLWVQNVSGGGDMAETLETMQATLNFGFMTSQITWPLPAVITTA